MVAKLYHAIHPTFGMDSQDYPKPQWPNGYTEVAILDIPNGMKAPLDFIFEQTNTIDSPWTQNMSVCWVVGDKMRSTSVGDIVELDGKLFYCDNPGWKPINDSPVAN